MLNLQNFCFILLLRSNRIKLYFISPSSFLVRNRLALRQFLFARMVSVFRILRPSCLVVLIGLMSSCSAPLPSQAVDAPVRIRWARDPETLDPFNQPNQNATDAHALLNGSLLAVNPQSRKFEPFLAEALPGVSYCGDSLTLLAYRLRPAATWDGGQPITSEDVAFTLKLLFCKGVPNEGFQMQAGFIQNIITDLKDARRFTLVCKGKAPDFVHASGDFPVLPEAALDPDGLLRQYSVAEVRGHATARRLIGLAVVQATIAARYAAAAPGQNPDKLGGCGPYRLEHWGKDRNLVFARKKKWWGDHINGSIVFQAKPAKLEYLIIPDEATASLALSSGQYELYPGVPARVFDWLKKSPGAQKKLAFYTSPTYEVMTAGFNTSRPTLSDAATRMALSHLFDAQHLSQASQLGQGMRTVGLISPQEKRMYNDSLKLLAYSPSTTIALLVQAGWHRCPEGWCRNNGQGPQQLRLQIRYRSGETNYELVAMQFASAAKSIGIAVSMSPTESGILRLLLQKGDYDVYVQSIKGNPFLYNFLPLLGTQAIGAGNLTRFGTPATDRLLQAVASAESTHQRELLLRRFQTMMRQQMPIVPLFFVANRLIASKKIAGLNVMSIKPGYLASTIYFLPKEE